MPAELLILALELGALYVLGSYAMSHLAGLANARGPAGKLAFYLLVMPGVVVHESAHYLACKLTLTPVGRFVPFAPSKDAAGRITLGYVQHGARNPISGAIIGLAPVVLNPLALVVLTGLITPIELTYSLPEASGTGSDGDPGRLLASIGGQLVEFASFQLPAFLLWAYLAVSLALGSCPSREDLVAVPAAAVIVVGVAWAYSTVYGTGFVGALAPIAAFGISVYLLPVVVAAVAALASVLLNTSSGS